MDQPVKSGKIPELMMGVKNLAALSACQDHADGVYFSVDRFSLRARACDVTLDDLNSFVSDVKEQGMNAYLTLNTVIYPDDLPELDEVIDVVASSDVDACACGVGFSFDSGCVGGADTGTDGCGGTFDGAGVVDFVPECKIRASSMGCWVCPGFSSEAGV